MLPNWNCILERNDSYRLKLSRKMPQRDLFLDQLYKKTYQIRKSDLDSRYQRGDVLEFGPLIVKSQFISYGKKEYSLAEVEGLKTGVAGQIYLTIGGKSHECDQISVKDIPDLHLLQAWLEDRFTTKNDE
jgi:hypothetical protein